MTARSSTSRRIRPNKQPGKALDESGAADGEGFERHAQRSQERAQPAVDGAVHRQPRPSSRCPILPPTRWPSRPKLRTAAERTTTPSRKAPAMPTGPQRGHAVANRREGSLALHRHDARHGRDAEEGLGRRRRRRSRPPSKQYPGQLAGSLPAGPQRSSPNRASDPEQDFNRACTRLRASVAVDPAKSDFARSPIRSHPGGRLPQERLHAIPWRRRWSGSTQAAGARLSRTAAGLPHHERHRSRCVTPSRRNLPQKYPDLASVAERQGAAYRHQVARSTSTRSMKGRRGAEAERNPGGSQACLPLPRNCWLAVPLPDAKPPYTAEIVVEARRAAHRQTRRQPGADLDRRRAVRRSPRNRSC
jgi:hypothetical protein